MNSAKSFGKPLLWIRAEVAEWADILLVLVLGSALSWLSQRFNFPNAVAQVVLGVVLGAAVLGWVLHGPLLHALGEVGVVILLGVAGLQVGILRLKDAGYAGIAVAILGIVLSVVGGYAVGWFYGSPNDESLYLGLALAATSIGITVQVLEQFGLVGNRVADIIMAAAVLDDVVALYFLGAAHGMLSNGLSIAGALRFVVLAILVLAALYALGRMLTQFAVRKGLIDSVWRRSTWILSAIALGAFVTESLDLSAVVGGFFMGVALGEGLKPEMRLSSAKVLHPLALIMMPFFFVMIGVQAQWDILAEPALFWFVSALIACAVISKAAGGALGALYVRGWRERWLIGFGMVPRGEVGLIIATLGFEQGHLTQPVFVGLVLTIIVVSALAPLLMAPVAKQLSSVS